MRSLVRSLRFAFVVAALGGGRPALAHEHTAPWLDESSLDGGLYVEVRHPGVIRNPSPFAVSVVLSNLTGAGDAVVREIRYRTPRAFDAATHRRGAVLETKRDEFWQYRAIREALADAVRRNDLPSVERLQARSQALLVSIARSSIRDSLLIEPGLLPDRGEPFELAVEIDLFQDDRARTLTRTLEIPVEASLPTGHDGSWFAGDQHLHTAFSIDAFLLEGTAERVDDYAATARAVGLDWIVITDHTNVTFLAWYRPVLFEAGEELARTFRDENDYLVLQGQEMGVGAYGRFGESAHLLVYPRAGDSTGFLPNPCRGLVFDHVNCEPEQVVLDRVNDNGGIGFIAHPFDSFPLGYAEWNRESDASGWAGLEIFNSSVAVFAEDDRESVEWWHELLNDVPPPEGGELADRPGFPTRFPVGLGNSDAHQPERIGATFTYARLPGGARGPGMVPRQDVMDAFAAGRAVASNGPLVYGEVNGAGVGDVALVNPADNELVVTLQTTPELGPVGDYRITVFVDGTARAVVPASAETGFEATFVLEDLLSPPDKFVTLEAERVRCAGCPADAVTYHAVANPIWLEFATGGQTPYPVVFRRGR
jgi:hypothetical protein